MTPEQLKQVALDELTRIAPEVRPDAIPAGANLRDQLDLDSMDFLNFVLALHERLHIDIPEADYSHLQTLEGIVEYLERKGPARADGNPAAGAESRRPETAR